MAVQYTKKMLMQDDVMEDIAAIVLRVANNENTKKRIKADQRRDKTSSSYQRGTDILAAKIPQYGSNEKKTIGKDSLTASYMQYT